MARRLGPQDPELESLLESVGVPEGEPTVHVKIDTIDTEVGVVHGVVNDILVDTGTTIPGTISDMQSDVDAILEDTGTTLPGTLSTIDGKVDIIDGNVDQALLDVADVKSVVDDILVDTGTTLPGTLSTIDGKLDTIDTVVDVIAEDIGDFSGSATTLKAEIESIKTIVDGISTASGSFTVLLEEQLERPESGTVDYMYTIMHRVNGVMTALDAAPTVALTYSNGTSADTLLYNDAATPVQSTTASEKSTGYYQGRVRIAAATTVGPLVFVVTGVYDTNTLKQARGTRIDEAFTLAWNSTDASRLENASDNTDTLLTDVAAVKAVVDDTNSDLGSVASDVTSIKATVEDTNSDVGAVASDVTSIKGTVEDNQTEIAVVNGKLDALATSSGVVFRATKATAELDANGDPAVPFEIVTLTSTEGFVSEHAKLYNVKVTPVAAVNNFEVEIHENAACTKLLAQWTKQSQAKPLNDNLGGYVYWNQDASPDAKLYVKVIHVSGAASIFNVEVRGDVVG